MSLNLGFETGHDLCARSAETQRRNPTETWHLRSQPPHRRARLHGLTSAWGYRMFALAVVLTLAWTVLGVVAVVALVHRGVTGHRVPAPARRRARPGYLRGFRPVFAYEQPTLTARYGAQYERYRTAVPAWLPRLHPWRQPADQKVSKQTIGIERVS